MAGARVKETSEGIQELSSVKDYDRMHRRLSEKGWTAVKDIIKIGIDHGHVLEVGPGPGYLGLDWLKKTTGTRLTGMDVSSNMIDMAEKNSIEYKVDGRVEYTLGDAVRMPFEDNTFDHVFTNGSLHEWENPVQIMNEIQRVLKPKGIFYISDLRRDMNVFVKWFMKSVSKPKSMIPGLITSIQAAYTMTEVEALLRESKIQSFTVLTNPMGLTVFGRNEKQSEVGKFVKRMIPEAEIA